MNRFISGSIFYNIMFVIFQLAYNFYVRGIILGQSSGTIYGAHKSPILGITLLLAVAGGTYSIMIRCRLLRIAGVRSAGITAFVVWVLNWVIVIFMVLTAVKAFGIDITKSTDMLSDAENTIIIVSILAAMVNAGFVIAFLARMADPYEKTVTYATEITAQMLAFIFSCVSYTAVWETIMYSSVTRYGTYDIHTGYGIFGLTGWLLSFMLLYPPMRLPFILQEIREIKQKRGRLRIALSYIAVLITGIIPLIKFN